ncbi:MAG: hypothetical protein ACM31L_19435 [Actinomycetota bacterium]
MTDSDPLALYFDGRDLDRGLSGEAEGGRGWYDFEGWSVTFGARTSKEQRLLVSVHEAFHSILTNCTVYGSLLHVAAHLHRHGGAAENAADWLGALIEPVRTAHEAYATYGSLFILGRGEPDVRLLAPYPAYCRYFDTARTALAGLDAPFLRNCGLNALFRLCLQPAGPWGILGHDASSLAVVMEAVRDGPAMHPDWRLGLMAGQLEPAVWARLSDEALERVAALPHWPAFRAHLRGELDYDAVSGREFDDVEQAILRSFYDQLGRLMQAAGAGSLSYDGHQSVTQAMVAEVERLAPAGRRTLVAATVPHREVDSIHEFGNERYLVREAPLVAGLRSGGAPRDMTFSWIEPSHLFLSVRYSHQVVGQFELSDQDRATLLAQPGRPLALLRRPVETDAGRQVELQVVDDPASLDAGLPVFANISLAALTDIEWQKRWWPNLRRATRATVLFDLPPFQTLSHWGERHGCRIDYILHEVEVEGRRHLAFLCRPDQGNLPVCVALVSQMVAQALDYYLTRQVGWAVAPRRCRELASEDPEALHAGLGHLLLEEHSFDFNCGLADGDERG